MGHLEKTVAFFSVQVGNIDLRLKRDPLLQGAGLQAI